MHETRRYITLRDYLRVLKQQRWLILAITVVFAAAAFLYSTREPIVYEAESSIVFEEPAADLDLFGSGVTLTQTPEARAAEGSVTVTQPDVMRGVIEELDLDTTVSGLRGRVNALAEARTNFVAIQAEASEPEGAADLANEVARQTQVVETQSARQRFRETARVQREALEESGDRAGDEEESGQVSISEALSEERIARIEALADIAEPVEIVSLAPVPDAPVSPRPVRNTLLGALLGLTLAIVAAFVRDSLDRRLRSARQIEQHMGLPLVGSVSAEALGKTGFASNGKSKLSVLDAEAFRILRNNLEFLDVDNPLRSFVITSGLPEEGKSTVAASLAYANAATGRRTLLLECDLRRPALAERLSLEPRPGLTECLAGTAEFEAVLQTVVVEPPQSSNGASADADETVEGTPLAPTFQCVTAGAPSPSPAELLGSQRFQDFLQDAYRAYDVVLLDSSPLLPVADTLEMVPHVDAVVVCVRSARTTHDEARAARSALENAPLRPTALVVTGVRPGEDASYGHYSYAYAYGHQRVR